MTFDFFMTLDRSDITKLTDKTSKIISYRANRFNNLFSGAETVIDHRDDILSFVNDYVNQPNEKLKSVTVNFAMETQQNMS
jgi:hypothetical protein